LNTSIKKGCSRAVEPLRIHPPVSRRNKKATTSPVLPDGNLRGFDLRIIRFLKLKRQASACPLIMGHIPKARQGQAVFLDTVAAALGLFTPCYRMYFV
jgi:hypothetical protein